MTATEKTDKKALMTVSAVHQSFGVGDDTVEVLRNIDFEVHDNTFNIIFGASGSGKSTLLNILTGLQPPTKGVVSFNGSDIYSLGADELARFRAHRIGIVYQQNYWVQSLTVQENVALPLYFMGYERPLAAEMALVALERVGMVDYAKRIPSLLSGGEQQRIGMARAIVNDPMMIVADEPTGNLDSSNGDKIMELLRTFHDDMRRTIILVTHNMEYLPLSDHLLHIQDGELQSLRHNTPEGMAEELLNDLRSRIAAMIKAKKTGENSWNR
jgi:putative ABC transport system ATP-binding protein